MLSGMSSLEMENGAIVASSWQRPPMFIDPSGSSERLLQAISRHTKALKNFVTVDISVKCVTLTLDIIPHITIYAYS